MLLKSISNAILNLSKMYIHLVQICQIKLPTNTSFLLVKGLTTKHISHVSKKPLGGKMEMTGD